MEQTKNPSTTTRVSPETLHFSQSGNMWQALAIVTVLVLVAGGAFFIGFVTAGGVGAGPAQQNQPEFQVFWEVWNFIENEFYYEVPSVSDRTYGAIRGLLGSLDDDYTSFVQPSIAEVERERMDGNFGGIGAYVTLNEFDQVMISYPFPNHPASIAGLEAGDIVLSVDGQSLENRTLEEGTSLIRGPIGTDVVLEIYRPGAADERFEVSITRDLIEIPTVRAELLDDNIGYVALAQFNGVATSQLSREMETLLAENPRALILDLRGNPGGLLDEAISVSDLFLPEGLVATQRTSTGEDLAFNSDTGDIGETIPLVVLIDGGSASASEIVAGAIQDHERGVLVGATTFGKGSVQLVHDLSDSSQLRVTYGAWYTPDEIELDSIGIVPDIEVEIPEEIEAGDDPWLDAAVEYIDEHYPSELP